MLIALLVALLAPQSSLEKLSAEAAPIALVRVERIHEMTQQGKRIPRSVWSGDEVRIAECTVERRVLGDPDQARVFIALDADEHQLNGGPIEAGARLLVFLEAHSRKLSANASTPTRTRLEQLAGPHGPALPLNSGAWLVTGQGNDSDARIPVELGALPAALANAAQNDRMALDELLAWLDAEVKRTTPTLRAFEVTNGPSPWRIELAADGHWTGSTKGQLDAAALADLWRRFDAERFAQMPEQVGQSVSPDTGSLHLRVRSLDGVREVAIEPCAPERLASDLEREQLARALRLWNALPGQRER